MILLVHIPNSTIDIIPRKSVYQGDKVTRSAAGHAENDFDSIFLFKKFLIIPYGYSRML